MKRKTKHTLITITILFVICGGIFAVREYGLYEQRKLQEKRQKEIVAFWSDYESAKNNNNELAKKIKKDFVNQMSEELSMEELLDLINKTLENPITLDDLISE